MTTTALRKIVKIDEEKCNGCGICIPSCAEGALQIVDGKAKLISEQYCDGLGACLGECPQDAITIEERAAAEFDEESVKRHLHIQEECPSATVTQFGEETTQETLPCGCPSATVTQFKEEATPAAPGAESPQPSRLSHWPVQLNLVPPTAPFLQGTDLLLAADCVPFAYAGFHQDFLKNHSLLVTCPKLDDFQAQLTKLANILRQSQVKSLTVVHMEVPCCFGLVKMAQQAVQSSGKDIPFKEITIGVKGDLKS